MLIITRFMKSWWNATLNTIKKQIRALTRRNTASILRNSLPRKRRQGSTADCLMISISQGTWTSSNNICRKRLITKPAILRLLSLNYLHESRSILKRPLSQIRAISRLVPCQSRIGASLTRLSRAYSRRGTRRSCETGRNLKVPSLRDASPSRVEKERTAL